MRCPAWLSSLQSARLACHQWHDHGMKVIRTLERSLQVKAKFGDTKASIIKATLRREATLIQRNSFIYIFRAVQV